MQLQTPKIEIYRTRTFTEKLTDTFNFLRENWRVLLKYVIYLMLPVSIVEAFFVNHFWNGYIEFLSAIEHLGSFGDSKALTFVLTTLAAVVVSLASYVVLMSLVYALIRLYNAREERLGNLSVEELKPELFYCLKRGFMLTLAGILLLIVVCLVLGMVVGLAFLIDTGVGAIITILGVILFYVALIVLVPPMTIVAPIYMMEDEIGVFAAYAKAVRLGFATWGGIFAISIVIGMLASVIQSVTMMPWYLLSMFKMVFTVAGDLEGSFFNTIYFTILQYLTCILQCLGYFIAAVITIVAVTMQYGHASDKIDGVGVARKIDNFDEFDNF